eukprot:6808727-Prymnesium_polylepis.1
MRVPSWCDRVLWRSWPGCEKRVALQEYDACVACTCAPPKARTAALVARTVALRPSALAQTVALSAPMFDRWVVFSPSAVGRHRTSDHTPVSALFSLDISVPWIRRGALLGVVDLVMYDPVSYTHLRAHETLMNL